MSGSNGGPSPELFDVLNAAGEPTGVVADKASVHAQGLYHHDVHVWITNGTHLLEQQRVWTKQIMPGAWDISVGGHVAAGETTKEAAIRETAEELGLVLPPERFLPAGVLAVEMAIEGWEQPHRTIGDNFVVYEPNLSLDQLTLRPEEVLGARLYSIDQLEADLSDPETAKRHAPQPLALWALGITAMRGLASV